ncbi:MULTISPECIES: MspA family porin [Tsukamurella]|uniref:MspA family porin n=2 Tax=Tsukamurella TaxID=2060 RepID=A0A5C5S5J0_9ACTN|nr:MULTISPECIES: MspA family porin [Tsukamurella]NMD55083.1 MspA family porin [Tsukamurella columbiensis]TWS30112.1 MspA family porin [Tsukamurella conjunctivitidis]
MTPRISLVAAALATTAATTVALLAPATAAADTVIPLRNASQTAKAGSGAITVSVTAQRARLSPGMVALPTTRNAWVSGVVSVKITGADADGGSIEAGYAVGCQIDVGSAGVEAGVDVASGASASFQGPTIEPSVTGTTGGSISLAAGSIGTQSLTYDRATWPKPGDEVDPEWSVPSTSFDFTGSSGSFTYSDQTIGVDGCAGYAQARLYVIVRAQVGDTKGRVVLWGDRFTLG